MSGFISKTLSLPVTGKLPVTLKNDILFHSTMSHSKIALTGLVSSLLHLNTEDIKDIIITNPIDYQNYRDKYVVLDVKILLNNTAIIDLELQTYEDPDWIDRSILYLCRSYDQLETGEDYINLMPTYLIAIMDYDLFPEYPEFYSQFRLMNAKFGYEYTSKFCLNVLNLGQIDNATDNDHAQGLVKWARAFSATTWDELTAIADGDPTITEVAKTMYTLTSDKYEKQLMEDHERELRKRKAMMAQIEDLSTKLSERDAEIADRNAELADSKTALSASKAEIDRLMKLLVANNIDYSEK